MSVGSGIIDGVSVWSQVVGQPAAVSELQAAAVRAARVRFSDELDESDAGLPIVITHDDGVASAIEIRDQR